MGSELKPDLSNIDNLADATPHYYGDNFPNGEVSDFNYSKQALALGGEVVYEMWALPPWATQPYTPQTKRQAHHRRLEKSRSPRPRSPTSTPAS